MIHSHRLVKELILVLFITAIIACGIILIMPFPSIAINTPDEDIILHGNIHGEIKSLTELVHYYKDKSETITLSTTEPVVELTKSLTNEEIVREHMGDDKIVTNVGTLVKMSLPSAYYDVDFSSYQPWMPASAITTKGSDSWKFLHGSGIYVDDNGIYRYQVDSSTDFNVNGNSDDYVVALGTFYKTRHVCGERFLVVTTNGWFTITTGDEQADCDTDQYNMFIREGGYSRLIEYIVDSKNLNSHIRRSGNVADGTIPTIKGRITAIYKIEK